MGFNFRGNECLLQQNWLRIEKTVDQECDYASFGFCVDTILPGTDYRFTKARGLFDNQSSLYGFDPVQFYASAYVPYIGEGMEIKVGRFFAPFGVESIASPNTPLLSRSYTFIYNPFTQTGLLATVKIHDQFTCKSGIVTGNDVFFDNASSPYYIGGLSWTSVDEKTNAELTLIIGNGRYDQQEQFNNPQIVDIVMRRKITEELAWAIDALYGFTDNVPSGGFANWYGVVNYLTYDFSDSLACTGRLEWFDDCQGFLTGTAGLYTAGTVGLTYKPTDWLWLRPEVRLDHHNNRPFNGDDTLFTAGTSLLFLW